MVSSRPKTLKPSFSQASDHHHSTESGALIGSNDDLLSEILLRLPAPSILRFKSVSKHWLWLLSHTHFTQRYDKLLKSPGLFAHNKYVPFDVENPNPPPFRSLDSYFDHSGIRIMQSCNGLLLCRTDRWPKGCKADPKYYVFNPTTKQLAIIPPVPGGLIVSKTICFMGLAFHQTDCPHYKVVCVRSLEYDEGLFQIQTYSSNTRKWKISVESLTVDTSVPVFSHSVYWKGAFLWAVPYLCFKIDVEQLQAVPLPEALVSSKISPVELVHYLLSPKEMVALEMLPVCFRESRGHLHLIVLNNLNVSNILEGGSLHCNVYEMLSDHSEWFVKYQLQLDELVGAFPTLMSPNTYDFLVIDVVRGEEEEDTFMVLKICNNIITFNVHDKSFKQIFSRLSTYDSLLNFHRYTETLTSF